SIARSLGIGPGGLVRGVSAALVWGLKRFQIGSAWPLVDADLSRSFVCFRYSHLPCNDVCTACRGSSKDPPLDLPHPRIQISRDDQWRCLRLAVSCSRFTEKTRPWLSPSTRPAAGCRQLVQGTSAEQQSQGPHLWQVHLSSQIYLQLEE